MNSLRALARGVAKKRMADAGISKVNKAMSSVWRTFVRKNTSVRKENNK